MLTLGQDPFRSATQNGILSLNLFKKPKDNLSSVVWWDKARKCKEVWSCAAWPRTVKVKAGNKHKQPHEQRAQEAENELRVGVGVWDDGGVNLEQVNTAVDRRQRSSSFRPSHLLLLMRLQLCGFRSWAGSRGRPKLRRNGQLYLLGKGFYVQESI